MASVSWNAEGVLLVDDLERGHTITGINYADLLRQLQEKIKKIWPGKLIRGVLFHQDNAQVHSGDGCHPGMQIVVTCPTPTLFT